MFRDGACLFALIQQDSVKIFTYIDGDLILIPPVKSCIKQQQSAEKEPQTLKKNISLSVSSYLTYKHKHTVCLVLNLSLLKKQTMKIHWFKFTFTKAKTFKDFSIMHSWHPYLLASFLVVWWKLLTFTVCIYLFFLQRCDQKKRLWNPVCKADGCEHVKNEHACYIIGFLKRIKRFHHFLKAAL